MIVSVNLGPRSYSIVVESGALTGVGERLRALGVGRRAALVTDAGIMRLHGAGVVQGLERAGFTLTVLEVPEGEAAKTLAVAEHCWDRLLAAGLDRTSTVLGLGGGAVGDLAGFVAATYMRGMHFVTLPTTVLAQVDASIGGKTAIDHPKAKNLVGAFHQPRLVVVDPAVVRTLARARVPLGARRDRQARHRARAGVLRGGGAGRGGPARPPARRAGADHRRLLPPEGLGHRTRPRGEERPPLRPELRAHHRPRAGGHHRLHALDPRRGRVARDRGGGPSGQPPRPGRGRHRRPAGGAAGGRRAARPDRDGGRGGGAWPR